MSPRFFWTAKSRSKPISRKTISKSNSQSKSGLERMDKPGPFGRGAMKAREAWFCVSAASLITLSLAWPLLPAWLMGHAGRSITISTEPSGVSESSPGFLLGLPAFLPKFEVASANGRSRRPGPLGSFTAGETIIRHRPGCGPG
jgi:hypothetical protein